ncbi:MAG: hypothetical protein IT436_14750 [Phycisphaerales bacterium]|nr:hypothetical protein [Phycisphaerales bacterium]
MRTKDLIELAQLHTLGVLDETETAEYERALAAASPGVMAQIRREQERLAQLHAVLPEVEPRPELRGLVVEAVRREVAIRHPQAAALRHGAGRVPDLIPGRRVSRLWRTAAVSLAAVAVVLSGFSVYVKIAQSSLQHKIENDAFTAGVLKEVGPQYANDILFGEHRRILFTSTDPALACRASILVSPRSDEARLFYNLPSNSADLYQVVALDDQGSPVSEPLIKSMTSNGGIQSQPLKIKPGSVTQLAIRAGIRAADSTIQWTIVATARIG